MLFNIEADAGDRISGFVVPDSFTKRPRIVVTSEGRELARFAAQEERRALVVAGRHETGMCGFRIDRSIIPDLPMLASLELSEEETAVVFYRRRPADEVLSRRVLRLETHLLPLWRLDDAVEPRFQLFFKGLERFGGETSLQVFVTKHAQSLYTSGRLDYRAVEHFVSENVTLCAMLRDPYCELAERLLVLGRLGSAATQHLGTRDASLFQAAIGFASALDLEDEKSLRAGLRTIPRAAAQALSNPLLRQLTSRSPDEPARASNLSSALGILANMDLVGLRSRPHDFLAPFAELVDLPVGHLPPVAEYARVAALGERLRAIRSVQRLLEHDLELVNTVESAYSSADTQINGLEAIAQGR